MSSHDTDELNLTLYRHGLSLAVLFDLLVQKGIVTVDEIHQQAQRVSHNLLLKDEEPDAPSL